MIAPDVRLGRDVNIPHPELVNLYGCTIGDGCKIASFVEIQRGVVLGKNVKVEAFAFIPSGLTIEDGVFIGPPVCFTNDRNPSAVDEEGRLLGPTIGRSSRPSSSAGPASGRTPLSSAASRLTKMPG